MTTQEDHGAALLNTIAAANDCMFQLELQRHAEALITELANARKLVSDTLAAADTSDRLAALRIQRVETDLAVMTEAARIDREAREKAETTIKRVISLLDHWESTTNDAIHYTARAPCLRGGDTIATAQAMTKSLRAALADEPQGEEDEQER